MAATIDAKSAREEYLKRYLSGPADSNATKKKKKAKKVASGMRIVEDDAFIAVAPAISLIPEDEDEREDLRREIEEKVELARVEPKFKKGTFQTVDDSNASPSTSFGMQRMRHDSDASSHDAFGKSPDVSDRSLRGRSLHDSSDEGEPGVGRDRASSARGRHDSSSDASVERKRTDHDSDASPVRKPQRDSCKDRDASLPNKRESGSHLTEKRKTDSDEDFSPKMRRNKGSDDDVSPKRRRRHDRGNGSSHGHRGERRSDSDVSPKRTRRHDRDRGERHARTSRGRGDSDVDVPRGRRRAKDAAEDVKRKPRGRQDSDSDKSSVRRKKDDSDNDLPRRRAGASRTDSPPIERRKQDPGADSKTADSDQDLSPPRRRRHHPDGDLSPVRKRRPNDTKSRQNDYDKRATHPRKQRQDSDGDLSPVRRRINDSESDFGKRNQRVGRDRDGVRRQRHDSDGDLSPPRRRARTDGDRSPSSRRKVESGNRKTGRASEATKRDSRWSVKTEEPESHEGSESATKTLDGKLAGLQTADALREEMNKLRENESKMFENLDSEVSGRNAETVRRSKMTGKGRETREDKEKKEREAKKQKELDEKYKSWNKGVQQIKQREEQLDEMARVVKEGFTRHADNETMNQHLKEVLYKEDPMLEHVKKKKLKTEMKTGVVYPSYKGGWTPNRFSIPPGYRWDGVDRSTGFEGRIAQASNAKAAREREYYENISKYE